MLETTIDALKAILRSDPTVSAADRSHMVALAREGPKASKPDSAVPTAPRILRRAEVAQRLSCSLRTVDKLPIRKVKLPGRTRAAGFLESDVNALLVGH